MTTLQEGELVNDPGSIFHGAPIISVYTRAQAIVDGVLVDVSETARQAHWTIPVAITAAVHAAINDIPKSHGYQDPAGRLWDVLWMGWVYARRHKNSSEFRYKIVMHRGRNTYFDLKVCVGPGDNAEPVVTIMLPDED